MCDVIVQRLLIVGIVSTSVCGCLSMYLILRRVYADRLDIKERIAKHRREYDDAHEDIKK